MISTHQREQDQLLCLVSQAQSGRMDEQRCSINPLSPRHMDNSQSGKSVMCNNGSNSYKDLTKSAQFLFLHTLQTDQDVENFFQLIANTQNRPFDDQRATLNQLPEIKPPHGMTSQDSDQLFSMVSRMQASKMLRCCLHRLKALYYHSHVLGQIAVCFIIHWTLLFVMNDTFVKLCTALTRARVQI